VIERFNRTLKTILYRYFTKNTTFSFLDILEKIVYSYNHTFHSKIKCSPVQVNKKNEKKIRFDSYKVDKTKNINFKFEINDQVLISKNKNLFEKGYTPNWMNEIFFINERILRYPPLYKIRDKNNEIIEGSFYEQELQKIIRNFYKIEKIIRRKQKNKYSLVKYKNYSNDFNEWVLSEKIIKTKNNELLYPIT
jgi:hypothetical protein